MSLLHVHTMHDFKKLNTAAAQTCLHVDVDGILHQMTFFYCLLWIEQIYCRSRTSRFLTRIGLCCKVQRPE